MGPKRIMPTLEAIAAGACVLLLLIAFALAPIAVKAGIAEKTVGVTMKCAALLLFCVFGFSCVGLLIHLFVVLQIGIGNGAHSMIRFLHRHETGVTLGTWAFLGIGVLLGMPFALREALGSDFQMPLRRSQGVFVADIGMTLDQVQKASTFKMEPPTDMGGYLFHAEDAVFEFRLPDSTLRFPQSRYLWLETGRHNDPHLVLLDIGITPRKLPLPELENFRHRIQSDLLKDGWMPGHQVADSEETVRLWGGKRTTGDGRYWRRGNTVLIIQQNRMDEEKRDEPPGSGEFILYLHLMPLSEKPDITFEPSAWTG